MLLDDEPIALRRNDRVVAAGLRGLREVPHRTVAGEVLLRVRRRCLRLRRHGALLYLASAVRPCARPARAPTKASRQAVTSSRWTLSNRALQRRIRSGLPMARARFRASAISSGLLGLTS